MKKIFLLFATCCLVLSAQAYDFEIDGIYYNITSDSTVEVTYKSTITKTYSDTVFIPGKVTNYRTEYAVTAIGTAACKNCNQLEAIYIPLSVTKIGSSAFYNCGALTDIVLPDSVQTIASYAFTLCSHLLSMNIPSSVTTIGSNAFRNCTGLEAMYTFPATPVDLSSADRVFNYINSNCILYVTTGSKSMYDTATTWKSFDTIIEFNPATSIEKTEYNYSTSSAVDTLKIISNTVGIISNSADWVHFNKNSYTDTSTIAFTVDENTSPLERSVVITLTAQGSTEKEITITQEGKAAAPVITSTAPTTAIVGSEYTYTVVASDSNGDNLTYTLSNAPEGMSISENIITWTPTSGTTTSDEITLTVSDGILSVTENFTIAVSENNAPVITSTAPTTATIGSEYTYTVVATDADGDGLTYTLSNAPEGMSISENIITWTLTSGTTTSDEVTLTVSDGSLTATEQFTITVSENSGTSVADATNENISLFPNPVSSILKIKNNNTIETIQVISITGSVVLSQIINNTETHLDIQSLQNGIYLLQINTSEGSIIKRIVKQ